MENTGASEPHFIKNLWMKSLMRDDCFSFILIFLLVFLSELKKRNYMGRACFRHGQII